MNLKISDYSNFDYKEEYWVKVDREYEHLCEIRTIQNLIKKIPHPIQTILDAGCAFGRLFPAYEEFGQEFILLDYAPNLLKEARANLKTEKEILFINGNAYEIPLADKTIDLVLTVRVLHHLAEPEKFIKEIARIIKPNGYFLLEIPNKRHIIQILRFISGKSKTNPFSYKPYYISETFVNYHPNHIKNLLLANNFKILTSTNTSFFRHPGFKKIFSAQFLEKADQFCQQTLSFLNLTPSVYLLCQKQG